MMRREDVPGLVLESGSYDALLERLKYVVPELLELNSQKSSFYDFTITSERHENDYVLNNLVECKRF